MKNGFNKQVVNDFINILSGSSSTTKMVNLLNFLLKSMSMHGFEKDLMDDFVDLFVVIYFKSS